MHNQTQEYYDRMYAAIGDKKRMLDYLVGDSVIDMGCGDGALVEFLTGEGYKSYGIDAAAASIEQANRRESIRGNVFEAYAHEGGKFFEPGTVDNILSSSLLHEVYSYGIPGGEPLSMNARYVTLASWRDLLRPGGRIIIRDGVIPQNWSDTVSIRFQDGHRYEDGHDMVKDYLNMAPFSADTFTAPYRQVSLVQTGDEEFSGSFESVMEFLYTYNWGHRNYPRETQELYGLFTFEEYQENAVKHGFEVVEAFEYLQPGYEEHLNPKVQLSPLDISHTTSLSSCETAEQTKP